MSDFSNPPTQPIYMPPNNQPSPAQPVLDMTPAIRKLKTVAILNIISGALSFCWALFMILYAVLAAFTDLLEQNPPLHPRAVTVAIFAAFALFCIIAGVVQLIAGIKLLKRTPNAARWAVVAVVANFLSVFLICCLPYYLFVAIYTLVVLSRPDVKQILPAPAASNRRPVSVTIIAFLSIAYGIMGVFGLVALIAQLTGVWPVGRQTNLYLDAPVWRAWIIACAIVGVVLFPLLIFVGRGLLRLRPWALNSFFALAALDILRHLVALALVPWLYRYMPVPSGLAAAKPFMLFGMLFSPLLAIALLVTFIILLSRPKIRLAFSQSPPTVS